MAFIKKTRTLCVWYLETLETFFENIITFDYHSFERFKTDFGPINLIWLDLFWFDPIWCDLIQWNISFQSDPWLASGQLNEQYVHFRFFTDYIIYKIDWFGQCHRTSGDALLLKDFFKSWKYVGLGLRWMQRTRKQLVYLIHCTVMRFQ